MKPTIIEDLGVDTDVTIGLLFAVPNSVAVLSLIMVSRHSDRTLESRYHAALPCLLCAIGLVDRFVCELPADCLRLRLYSERWDR